MLCRSRDSALALRGRGHRPAYRLRILRCQIARYAEESMFGRRIHDRQLSPEQMVAAIRIDLVHHLDQRLVPSDQYALLAIAGETHVPQVASQFGGWGAEEKGILAVAI